jgi:hypothetical protein
MDYAYVPGFGIGIKELDLCRAVLALRPQTGVAPDPTAVTLETYLGALDVAIGIGLEPADNVIAGSHGTGEGELYLAMDKASPVPTVYETLEAVKASGSIRVGTHLGASNPAFRLVGCLIGSDESLPFLRLMKQALQHVSAVSAPRFVHSYRSASDASYAFEFMEYAHRITSKDPLTSRDAVIGKFGSADLHQDLDGSEVPIENWDKWVPKGSLNLAPVPGSAQQIAFDLPVKISPAAGGNSTLFKDLGSWHSIADTHQFEVETPGAAPTGEADQIALVPLALGQLPEFQDNHPYPVFKRHHFKTRQAFIDGFRWKPTLVANNTVNFIGTRYRYELHVPVLKPGTDELIYNFYPNPGTPVINFTESNQPYKLFGVV